MSFQEVQSITDKIAAMPLRIHSHIITVDPPEPSLVS